MRKKGRILSLLLSCLLVLTFFASCNENASDKESTGATLESSETSVTTEGVQIEASDSETETVGETEIEYVPEIAKTNYEEQLYMQVYGDDSYMRFIWAEEGNSDLLSEAVFNRQVRLQEHIGVELVGITHGTFDNYSESFKQSIKNKDGSIDVLIPNSYMPVANLIDGGYARNLDTLDYLNFDADYWKLDYMDSISLVDRHYLGYSDFNTMKTYVFTFNKDMLDRYMDQLDETLYESVYNYRWTLDKMISVANLVYIDNTADGKTADDTFGISGIQWSPFITFLHASNIKLVEQDESGAYKVSVYNELNSYKTSYLVDKLKALAESDCAWFRYRIESTPVVELHTGRALMNLNATVNIDDLLQYEVRFGILPYPMYDELQKDVGYMSLNHDGYIMVASYLTNEKMVGQSLELLSYYSKDVQIAVHEKWLGKQAADAPDDNKMLDIIWDGICPDFGLTYSTITYSLDENLYLMPKLTQPGTTKNLASYVKSYEKEANSSISKYLKKIARLEE